MLTSVNTPTGPRRYQTSDSNLLFDIAKAKAAVYKQIRGHSPEQDRKDLEQLVTAFNFNVSNKSGTRLYQPSDVTMNKLGKGEKSKGATSS